MTKILYIKSSPRGARSHSIAVAEAFLRAYGAAHPDHQVVTLDVFTADLPSFDGETIQGKYNIMHGQAFSPSEKEAWRRVETIIAEFNAADKYVFAVPMWNFMIPYRLKQYIDLICQPGYTFSVGPEGYKGLASGKAYVSYARGGQYAAPESAPSNFQSPYLEFILGFMGLTDVVSTAVEGALLGPEIVQASKAAALAKAEELALRF